MAQQNGFEIYIERTRTNADSLQEFLEAVQHDMTRMKSSFDALNSRWTGPAHNTFVRELNSDYEQAFEIWEEMMQSVDDIKDSCADYSNCESEVLNMVRSIRIGG